MDNDVISMDCKMGGLGAKNSQKVYKNKLTFSTKLEKGYKTYLSILKTDVIF